MQDNDTTPLQSPTSTASKALAASSGQEATPPPTTEKASGETQPPKKNKKQLVIAGIVAGAVVLLGGGGAAAYNVWYQNPDKVLSDALTNVIKAKSVAYTGSFSVTSDNPSSSMQAFSLTLDGKNEKTTSLVNAKIAFTVDKKDYKLSGSGMYDKDGNIYVKVNDVRKLVDSFNTDAEAIPQVFSDILTKIDGKWIKISADDLKEFSPDYAKTQTCSNTAMEKFANDNAVSGEIIDLYKKNTFIVVKEKLASQNGSLGYVIDSDDAKAKSFAKGLNNTALFKELKKCDASLVFNEDDISADTGSDKSTSRVEVWVSSWSHQLTKVQVSDKSDGSTTKAVIEPMFNQQVVVTPPSSFIKLSELKADIERATAAFGESFSAGDSVQPVDLDMSSST